MDQSTFSMASNTFNLLPLTTSTTVSEKTATDNFAGVQESRDLETMAVSDIQKSRNPPRVGWRRTTAYGVAAVLFVSMVALEATAFVPSSDFAATSNYVPQSLTTTSTTFQRPVQTNSLYNKQQQRQQTTQLYSFMGSDGGILGIGTPELVRHHGVFLCLTGREVHLFSQFSTSLSHT